MADDDGVLKVASNRRARHDYEIVKTFECGLVLQGHEVKSLREGHAQLRESFARVDGSAVWVHQLHIPEWKNASSWDKPDPTRPRKLLLNHREIEELRRATEQKGLTIVPLSLYFRRGRAKLEIGLARGRKSHDKRHAIAERDVARDTARELRWRNA